MKNFQNRIWVPQVQLLVAAIMVFLMLPCLPACDSITIMQPETKEEVSIFHQPEVLAKFEADAKAIREDIGGVHNGIIIRFYSKKPGKLGEKIPLEDFRKIFTESFNEEVQARGLQIQLTETDVNVVMQVLADFMEDTGIDFTNPESINPLEALDKLVSKGYITEEDARHCKHTTKCLEEGVNPYEDERGLLTTTILSDEAKLYDDVIIESYPLWSYELHELYPELGWDWPTDIDWHSLMEKIGPYISDGLGTIAGGLIGTLGGVIGTLIGAAVGCALASIAFETITWLGNMGYL